MGLTTGNGAVAPQEPTIVVVDDDPLIGEIVGEALEAAGYRVVLVQSGEDAMDVMWKAQPALALIDCALPERPGMVVVRDLRESAMFEKLPIVMLTGRRSEWHESIALREGANAYIRKPFDVRELLVTVARLLRDSGVGAGDVIAS